jgi:glycosyltransferase involved in cell wall biosynthesis
MGQRRARAILVCNQEAMGQIPRKWKYKAHLFPINGLSSRDLSLTASSRGRNAKFQVLSAGQIYRIKGFPLAIRAFNQFASHSPEAEFTIIGSGPDLPGLQALVRGLGLEEKVHLRPWMPRDELLAEMAACDVFLFPSLRDGGVAVVVEAMAASKPVICLDVGGPGFHVTDKWGVKVTPHSPEQAEGEMAAALERLYLDKELRYRMGRAARERAERFYHSDRLGERMQQIYEQALGNEATQSPRAI